MDYVVHYNHHRNRVPQLPNSLDSLHGPNSGFLTLPISLFWQTGNKDFNLSDHDDLKTMYRAVLNEGTVTDCETYLNKEVIIDIWPELLIGPKLAAAWEKKFPALHGNRGAACLLQPL